MTGLLGWWPLHEDSGSKAYDLSGNDNHGSLNGGVTQGVAGKGGLTGYSFDGSDDSVKASGAELDTTSPPWTFTAWIKRNGAFGNEQKFFGQAPSDGTYQEGQFSLQFSNSSHPEQNKFYIGVGGGSTEVIGNTAVEDRNWHHVALSYDGSEWKVYLDGNLDGSTTSVPSPSNVSANPLWLGGVYNSWSSVNMADLRFYSRQLSSEEIQELYEWGKGDYARPLNDQNSSSAVSRWALDGDVTDSWSSNDGTTSGGLNFTDNAIRGQAANFDGSDDYITFSDSGDESTWYPSELTVSAWVRPDNSNNWARIISGGGSLDGSTSDAWALQRIDSSNHAFGIRVNGTYYNAETPDNLPAGEWSHVCGTYDGDKIKFYTNGSLRDVNRSPSGHIEKRTNPILIGRRASSEYYSGLVDDVRIYDKALSPQEVFELYRWGTGGRDLRKFTVNSRGL